jgi:hypothetical protein
LISQPKIVNPSNPNNQKGLVVSRQIDFDSYNNICINVAEKTNEKVINYTKRKFGNDSCPKNEFQMKTEKLGISGTEKNRNTDFKLRNVEAFNMNISERIYQNKNNSSNDNKSTPPVKSKPSHQWVNSNRNNFASITLVETHDDSARETFNQNETPSQTNPTKPAEPLQTIKPEDQKPSLERLRHLYKKNRRMERANANIYSSSTIP